MINKIISKSGRSPHPTTHNSKLLTLNLLLLALLLLFASPVNAQMVNDMTAATSLSGSNLFYVVQGSSDRKLTWSVLYDAYDDSIKAFLLNSFEGSVNLKAGSIGLSNLSTAVLNYIGSGGSITNNPDDVTLENKSGSTIGLKRNQPNQLNFLGGAKWGSDSTWRANKDSLVVQGLNKPIRFRFDDHDSLQYIIGTHRTEYSSVYDYVFWLSAYNTGPTGNRLNTEDASFALFFESNYYNGVDSVIEFNLQSTLVDGTAIRPYQVQWNRNWLDRIYHLFLGRVQYQPTTKDSVAIVIQDYGYANRTRFRIHNVDEGGYYDFHLKRNETNSDLVLSYNGLTPVVQFNNTVSKFNYNLYVTNSDWNMTTHADTVFHRYVTSPGYGIDRVKHYYLITDDWNISDASFTSKIIFQYSSGALTLGGTGTIGTGPLYAGSYYVSSTKVIGARDTGWTAFSGTPDESTSWDVSTVTLPQLAARVAALQVALTTHGLIGP